MMTPHQNAAIAAFLDEVHDRLGWTRARMAAEIRCPRRQLTPVDARVSIDLLHQLATCAQIDDATFDELLAPPPTVEPDGAAAPGAPESIPDLLRTFHRAIARNARGTAALALARLDDAAERRSERALVLLCEVRYLNACAHPLRAMRRGHQIPRDVRDLRGIHRWLVTELARSALALEQPERTDALLREFPARTMPDPARRVHAEALRRLIDTDPTAPHRAVVTWGRFDDDIAHAARLEAHAAAGEADPDAALDDIDAMMSSADPVGRVPLAMIASDLAARHLAPERADPIIRRHAHRILTRARTTSDWHLHATAFRLQIRARRLVPRPTWRLASRRIVELLQAVERFPWLRAHLHDVIAYQAAGALVIEHSTQFQSGR